jgi:multidrug resistance efflux pump
MNSPTPIPTPAANKWREFRIQVVPVIVFVASVIAAVYLWKTSIASTSLQAMAESPQAQVTSSHPGTLLQVKVSQYQQVKRGEAVAVLLPVDTRAPLSAMQSELNLLKTRLNPQRNAMDFQRLRLEVLLQKVQLATDQVTLRRAESEFERNSKLYADKLVSQELFELSERDRDIARVEVQEKTKLIAELERNLGSIGDSGMEKPSDETAAIIKAQEERLKDIEAILGPITLTSPIDGVVSFIYRQAGENVRDGEPIMAITGSEPNRLTGYLRQPLPSDLRTGIPVEVRTRSLSPVLCRAAIMNIGPRLEPITNSLASARPGLPPELGLPIEFNMPSGLKVRPGEIVDLVILPH